MLFLSLFSQQAVAAVVENGQDSIADQGMTVTYTPPLNEGTTSIPAMTEPSRVMVKSSFRPYHTSEDSHPMVASYIQSFKTEQRSRFEKKHQEWMPYFRVIDQIFLEYGIPSELKYL